MRSELLVNGDEYSRLSFIVPGDVGDMVLDHGSQPGSIVVVRRDPIWKLVVPHQVVTWRRVRSCHGAHQKDTKPHRASTGR